jgi:hypothetical protein
VVHTDQPRQLDRRADLLEAFAGGGGRRVFVVVDKPTGQAPEPIARLDRAPAEDDAAFDLHDHGGRHLGVMPEDEAVVGARLHLATFDDAHLERRAAVDAEVTHSN